MPPDQRLLSNGPAGISDGKETGLRCCRRTCPLLGNIRIEQQLASPTNEPACNETSPEKPGTIENSPRSHGRRLQEKAKHRATRTNRRNNTLEDRTAPAIFGW